MTTPTDNPRLTRFYIVAPDALDRLRQGRAVDDALAALPLAPSQFDDNASYLAFALGYLEDESLLEPVDEPFTQELGLNAGNGIFSLYAPARADVAQLQATQLDGERLAREYFAEPILDRSAIAILLNAVKVIRENLSRTPTGDLLLVQV